MDQLNINVQAHDIALLPQLPFDQHQFHFDDLHTGCSNSSSQKQNPAVQAIQNLTSSGCSPTLLLALVDLLNDAFRPHLKTLLLALDLRIVTLQDIRTVTQSSLNHGLIDHTHSHFGYQTPKEIQNICSPISIDYRLSGGTLYSGLDDSHFQWNFEDHRTSLNSKDIRLCSEDSQLWQNQMASELLLPHPPDSSSRTDDVSMSFTSTLPQSPQAQISYHPTLPVSQVTALQGLNFLNEDKFQLDDQILGQATADSSDRAASCGVVAEQSAQGKQSDGTLTAHASSETKPSHARNHSQGRNFIAFKPPKPKARERSSFCPECTKDFTSSREFLCHMNAVHDQPIEFRCKHFVDVHGKQSRCNHRSFVFSRYRRHHTTDHVECTTLNEVGSESSSCRQEVQNPQPRRFWGCGICINLSENVETWLKHHMEFHKDHDRSAIDHTTLMRSYLSHPFVRPVWCEALQEVYPLTDTTWQLQSSLEQDPRRHKIMVAFKTGLWEGHDIYADRQSCRDMVTVVMKMVEQDRTKDNSTLEPGTIDRNSCSPLGRTRSFCSTLLRKRSKSALSQPHSNADTVEASVPQLPTYPNYLMSK